MKIYTGTSHFSDCTRAIQYYKPYGYSPSEVREKIKNGEISIGAPEIKKSETCFVNSEGRYVIES